VKCQPAGRPLQRLLDCNIETRTDYEAEVLESDTTTMMMMMMMMTKILMMMMMVVVW
jgi:hypothetical protein